MTFSPIMNAVEFELVKESQNPNLQHQSQQSTMRYLYQKMHGDQFYASYQFEWNQSRSSRINLWLFWQFFDLIPPG